MKWSERKRDFGGHGDIGNRRIRLNILHRVDFLFQELAVAQGNGATATIIDALHNTDMKSEIWVKSCWLNCVMPNVLPYLSGKNKLKAWFQISENG